MSSLTTTTTEQDALLRAGIDRSLRHPVMFFLTSGAAWLAVSLILGIIYWMVFAVFTKFGEVGNLPPLLSAWAGNILFALAAVYSFLHVGRSGIVVH